MKNNIFTFLLVCLTTWLSAQVPVVIKTSEGVGPNGLVNLYGEYITGTPSVKFVKKDGSVAATVTPVQTDPSGKGHYCTVSFPAITPGAYLVKVTNASGESTKPIYINRADPRWIWKERMYVGMKNKLLGRCLDASEYNGAKNTKVRLVPTGGGVAVVINADNTSTALCVDFTVPAGLSSGNYYIEVNTNSAEFGSDWIRLNNHFQMPSTVADEIVSIEGAPTDVTALALDVAWANDFNWTNVVNVKTSFGAVGNGTTDDTQAFKNALNSVKNNGGGVVYVPNGNYLINSTLNIGTKCILKGESNTGSVLLYGGATIAQHMITSNTLSGICNLKLTLKSGFNKGIDLWMMFLGDDWYNRPNDALANRIFVYNNVIDGGLTNPEGSKVRTLLMGGKGPLLAKGNTIYGSTYGSNLSLSLAYEHGDMIGNTISATAGFVTAGGKKAMILNNDIKINQDNFPNNLGTINGLFLGGPDTGSNMFGAYAANNTMHDIQGNGDGQPWAIDGGGFNTDGYVTTATATTVDFNPNNSSGIDATEWVIMVCKGKGMGQQRRVVSSQASGSGYKLNIAPAWDVIPDATSYLSFSRIQTGYDVENNTATDCKGISGFYRVSYDCTVAGDVGVNTQGMYVWGSASQGYIGAAYFTQVKKCQYSSTSTSKPSLVIALRAENDQGAIGTSTPGVYGTDLRGNVINKTYSGSQGLAEIEGTKAGIGLEARTLNSIMSTIVDANTIIGSSYGVSIRRANSTVLKCNTLSSTPSLFIEDNAPNTLSLACNQSTVAVTGVSVSPTSASLPVGNTRQLTATIAPSNATDQTVTWSTSNAAVATVSTSGLVTGVAVGIANITVTTVDGSKIATSAITVTSVSSGGDGLKGEYYNTKDFSGAIAVTRVDANVNFSWGTGSYATSQPVDNFSARWTGQILPKYTETYTFETETDDGVRLWVNDVQLINKWIDQGPTKFTGTISLIAGTKYNIKMEYYENGGGAVAKLRWSSASQAYEVIPQSQLFSTVVVAPVGISVLTTQVPASSDSDQPYELGMKFRSTQAGTITKIRYYKISGETGTHTGRIWTSTGTQLASVVFSGETANGWQVATLSTPLSIAANTTYVVSVNSSANYAVTQNGLQTSIVNGTLSSVADGANGVYNTTPGLFPNSSYNNTNYFRDVVFISTSGGRLETEQDISNDIVIYPNPTTGEFQIEFANEGPADVIITNPSSQSIVNFKRSGNINEKINLSNHGNGLYLLRIQNGKGVSTKKIVIDK